MSKQFPPETSTSRSAHFAQHPHLVLTSKNPALPLFLRPIVQQIVACVELTGIRGDVAGFQNQIQVLRCGLNRKGDRQNEGWGDLTVCLTRYILSLFICTSTGVAVHRSRLDSFACLKQQIPTILSWLCHHLTMITQHNSGNWLICVFKEFFSDFLDKQNSGYSFTLFLELLPIFSACVTI